MVVARGWGKGDMGNCLLMDTKFLLYKMNKARDLLYHKVPSVNYMVSWTLNYVTRTDFMLNLLKLKCTQV